MDWLAHALRVEVRDHVDVDRVGCSGAGNLGGKPPMSEITYTCPCGWQGDKPRISEYKGREWYLCPDCGMTLDTDSVYDPDAANGAREDH